jgi:hypothetical protein
MLRAYRSATVEQAEDLDTLAARINRCQDESDQGERTSLEKSKEAGDELLKAKELCLREGKPWLPWLKAHVKRDARRCREDMQIARNWDKISSLLADSANMGRERALSLLRPGNGSAARHNPDAFHDGLCDVRELESALLHGSWRGETAEALAEQLGIPIRAVHRAGKRLEREERCYEVTITNQRTGCDQRGYAYSWGQPPLFNHLPQPKPEATPAGEKVVFQ